MFTLQFASLTGYILVFARMAGCLLFNPVLSRKNVPARFKVALILGLTLLIAPNVSLAQVEESNALAMIGALFLELLVGFVCSFVFQFFYYMLFFAGDLLDVEFGLSMAKVFDPGTNIQMSITSTLLNLLFVLYLFTTNSHLLLVKLFASSYMVVPVGGTVITSQIPSFFLQLFSDLFSLVLQLALPFVTAMFVSEVAMGVLMKLVPQIHVFVISIQFKIMVGILLMLLFAEPISDFVTHYMELMFLSMNNVLSTLVPTP